MPRTRRRKPSRRDLRRVLPDSRALQPLDERADVRRGLRHEDEERKRNRGAFFGSLHRTLNHILWGDRIWLARFTGETYDVKAFGTDMFDDFGALSREREIAETRMLDWAGILSPQWLAGTVQYVRSADATRKELPAWIAATHLFQHAAYHRGQATTLLKQAGHDMGVTDLQYLPGIIRAVD